jgi:hypothetical protein
MVVVEGLRSLTSRDDLFMFYAAYFRFDFVADHISGTLNTAVDAISRNNLLLFHSLVPQIPEQVIPQSVLDLLVIRRPDWGSCDCLLIP